MVIRYPKKNFPNWLTAPTHYQDKVEPEELPFCFRVFCTRCSEYTTQEWRALTARGSAFMCRHKECFHYNYAATPKVMQCLNERYM